MPRPDLSATDAADRNDTYAQFLSRKAFVARDAGKDVSDDAIHPSLFAWQKQLVRWSLRKGRAALWTGTGTGKTRMSVEFARLCGEDTLIVAPLAVAQQTIREASSIGVEIKYARRRSEVGPITVTNYEMVEDVGPERFPAVVLDEASRVKDYTSKTRNQLISLFRDTPWKLACTATPAPNDVAELANHAEFLNVMTRTEMLATFFVHDDQGWRLKGHARRPFFRWLSSWAMSMTKPSDLGYDDGAFILPPLEIEPVIVQCEATPADRLFFAGLKGVGDRAATRKATASDRVQVAADLIRAEPDEPWIAWCGINPESDALAAMLPDCVHVYGSQTPDQKADLLLRFVDGKARVMVSKASIAGHGLNLQRCARMVFVGLNDSFEAFFQAVRRCWRFGQTRPVKAYIVLSEVEQEIYANVLRKQREHEQMNAELIREVAGYEREEMRGIRAHDDYEPSQPIRLPEWLAA